MSNTLSALSFSSHRRNQSNSSSASLPPLLICSDTHTAHSVPSSSPPHSSSPPRTPFSFTAHSYPDIQSSPMSERETFHRRAFGLIDEPSPFWQHHQAPLPANNPKQIHPTLPSFDSSFPDTVFRQSVPLSSPPRFSLFHQKHPTDSYRRFSPVFYDSEDEETHDEEGYSFVEEDVRTTFFRTSAERGQWRYDPIPIKTEPRSHLRQSAPTSSSRQIQGIHRNPRPGSEPALSTTRLSSPVEARELHVDQPEISYCVENVVTDPLSPPRYHASLPSLTSDSEPDHSPLSPLPPSSPPLSSYSVPNSPMRPITPMSFAPISPMRASSLLSSDHHAKEMAIEEAKGSDGVSVLLCDSSETDGGNTGPVR